jgi:DNA-binding CsgD family transcriptional regulator
MLYYLGYLIFILSVALAAGGIMLSVKLRNTYNNEIFSTLLYYEVFIYTFGFYGIWGQAVIKALLSDYISAELLARFSEIAMLLGLPFVIFAWLMLIRFSHILSGRKINKLFVPAFLTFNFSMLIGVGYLIAISADIKPVILIKTYYIAMNLLWTLLSSSIILYPEKGSSLIHDFDRKRIAPALIVVVGLQCIPLFFYENQMLVATLFIMAFFAGNSFLPVYLSYGTLLSAFTVEPEKDLSFEQFCRKFEVSPRETDIVREICNGLSNQEISDKLFISLQTVKDHTHRIYIKTNVRSRVQLINLVKELKPK